jgi:lipase
LTAPYRRVSVPVPGGELAVGVWGDSGPVVLAIHGVTSSHLTWLAVAERVGSAVTLVAPDLRGRGDSGHLPGPCGMARHAADCVAVLDTLGQADAVVAGHSMGGFVAVVLADSYPDRVRRLVLIDGGAPLPPAPGDTPEEQLAATIGPAAARLSMRFETRAAYRDYWRQHPALRNWTPLIESYIDYDLTGTEPELRSKVSLDAVRDDSIDLMGDTLTGSWQRLRHDAVFLRAERGLLDQVPPLYPDPAPIAARMPVRTVAGTNHYTVVLEDLGASTIAEALADPA